jgi:hypothetical protein
MSITRKLIIVSLAMGIAASLFTTLGVVFFPGPFGGMRKAVVMLISLTPMVMWIARFIFVLIQHGTKGLWFLMGFPIAVCGRFGCSLSGGPAPHTGVAFSSHLG